MSTASAPEGLKEIYAECLIQGLVDEEHVLSFHCSRPLAGVCVFLCPCLS